MTSWGSIAASLWRDNRSPLKRGMRHASTQRGAGDGSECTAGGEDGDDGDDGAANHDGGGDAEVQVGEARALTDCGKCINCRDKCKYGGPGKRRQKCIVRQPPASGEPRAAAPPRKRAAPRPSAAKPRRVLKAAHVLPYSSGYHAAEPQLPTTPDAAAMLLGLSATGGAPASTHAVAEEVEVEVEVELEDWPAPATPTAEAPWSPWEDARLVDAVRRRGEGAWTAIAREELRGRTRHAIRNRWRRNPRVRQLAAAMH